MSYNGSGTFQINTSGQPVVAGTVISSTAFNALTADLATGLSTAITKDGQTTTTARIPFAAGINSSLTTDSTNSTSGSIITAGGVGVAKAVFIGTTLNVAGASTMTGAIAVDSVTDSTSTTTGSIQTDGGVGIAKTAYIGTNLSFAGTGNRITGDFSNATIANRVFFQTSSTNSTTSVGVIPSGTDTSTELRLHNNSDPTNSARAMLSVNVNDVRLVSGIDGTGTYLPMTFLTGGSERVRVDTSGNVGIGTSSPTSYAGYTSLALNNATSGGVYDILQNNTRVAAFFSSDVITTLASITSIPLAFRTANTERMRIDSSGNLLVGTTSVVGAEKLNVTTASADRSIYGKNTSGNPFGMRLIYSGAAPNATGNEFIFCDDTGGLRFSVRSNGGIANYQANNANLSDRREKTNFAPAGDYLAKICAIPVQTFNYIDQNIEEDDGLTLGVVAQDVQAIAPELVMESNWAAKDDEPKMRLSIYQTDLQYALMKCIQEQQALIVSMREELDALKTKVGA
jgi:hypothetical protein